MDTYTFEVDLFRSGLAAELVKAMNTVGTNEAMKERMKDWAKGIKSPNVEAFLQDIDTVGKGRLAQRLAGIITESGAKSCPEYIAKALEYVTNKCKRG